MNKLLIRAFTLIELLVVIAVIGILSGLIVVSMSGVTNKATIAKAQIFSNSLKNSLMTNLVSEWKLDGNANDSWNGGNVGTLKEHGYAGVCDSTHCPLVKSSEECIYETCFYFDGANDYIEFSDIVAFENIDKITISAWVFSDPSSNYRTVISKGYSTNGSWELRMGRDSEGPNLTFGVVTNLGRVASTISGFKNSIWHYVVGSYDGAKTYIYYDGVLVDSDNETGNIVNTLDTVKIGQSGINSEFWNGKIDDVRMYDAAISFSQIKEQYYSGLNSLLSSNQLSFKEYQERISRLTTYSASN